MEFTFEFLGIFVRDLLHAGPLLIGPLLLIALIGIIIGRIEDWSPPYSLYHAFINATTVCYGDFRPSNGRARFLAVLLALTGLVFTGLIVAIALHAADYAFDRVYEAGIFAG